MRYPVYAYAKALASVLIEVKGKGEAQKHAAAKNFIALVRRSGDEAHLKKILDEAARLVRARENIRKLTIESARELTPAQEALVEQLTKPDDVVERAIDPELIAGVRIIMNDEMQFDGTLRGKLDTVFRNI